MKNKTALVFGASGLTGKYVIQELIHSDKYDSISVFSRKLWMSR